MINFSFHIDNITADFLNNGGVGEDFSSLEGYDTNKTSSSDISGFVFSDNGPGTPITLGWVYPGPDPFSPIRTLHLSQDLANNDFVTIDNINFTQVPEPSTTWWLMLTLSLTAIVRRRLSFNG